MPRLRRRLCDDQVTYSSPIRLQAEVIVLGRSGDKASTASVSYRRADDLSEVTREWTAAGIDELAAAAPWRTFRWYRGQRHYSGTYWSSTVGGHVIYESRLELARLLFADFDARVRHIVAQPFLLRTSVDRKPRKHIPDYLLIKDTGPVVVDVKPARRLADPKVASTFEWTREIVEARGWRYEVATEPQRSGAGECASSSDASRDRRSAIRRSATEEPSPRFHRSSRSATSWRLPSTMSHRSSCNAVICGVFDRAEVGVPLPALPIVVLIGALTERLDFVAGQRFRRNPGRGVHEPLPTLLAGQRQIVQSPRTLR